MFPLQGLCFSQFSCLECSPKYLLGSLVLPPGLCSDFTSSNPLLNNASYFLPSSLSWILYFLQSTYHFLTHYQISSLQPGCPVSCFCTAYELRMDFTFLKGCNTKTKNIQQTYVICKAQNIYCLALCRKICIMYSIVFLLLQKRKFPRGQRSQFYFLLYLQQLEQCVEYNRHSVNIS